MEESKMKMTSHSDDEMAVQLSKFYDSFVVPMYARHTSNPTAESEEKYELMRSVYDMAFRLHEKNRRMAAYVDVVRELQQTGSMEFKKNLKLIRKYHEISKNV